MTEGSKTELKNAQVKLKIKLAAARLFQEQGFPATSMRELAQKVGLEASSLYNYIKSKDELLIEICTQHSQTFMRGLDEVLDSSASIEQKLTAIIEQHVILAFNDPSIVTVFNDEWKHLPLEVKSEFIKQRKHYENRILKLLESGMEEGTFQKLDPKICLYSFLSALKWVHYGYKPDKLDPKTVVKQISEFLLKGLMIRP